MFTVDYSEWSEKEKAKVRTMIEAEKSKPEPNRQEIRRLESRLHFLLLG